MGSCNICGGEISSGNKLCQQCMGKQKMDNQQMKEDAAYRKEIKNLSSSRLDRFPKYREV